MDLLGEYSSSSSDDDDEKHKSAGGNHEHNTASFPSVPKEGQVKIVDSKDASLNNLFVRDVPHTRGNWAGHVFVEIPLSTATHQASVSRFASRLKQAGWSGTVVSHSNLHLSLSRPFFLLLGFIEPFVKALTQRLEHQPSTRLLVTGETTLLVNETQTRSFWCLNISCNDQLLRILQNTNKVLLEYQQAPYYESPKFHVSVASVAGNVKELLEKQQQECNGTLGEAIHSDDDDDGEDAPIVIAMDHVCVTFGTTKSFRIDLKPS